MRALRIAAWAEAVSLVILLVNLLTTHTKAVATIVGPLHGMAYLVVVATTLLARTDASPSARWFAVVPGIGGLLAMWRDQTSRPAR
ncbi:DUF3817 domain-containing protein [Nonomuraea sp. NPDC000554]|uniref:DUF3817 domain-containing protein n=1 Tax=Nonomuraea sp. NPDC000554 TaxID=3154259 RepID=UPI00331EB99A